MNEQRGRKCLFGHRWMKIMSKLVEYIRVTVKKTKNYQQEAVTSRVRNRTYSIKGKLCLFIDIL